MNTQDSMLTRVIDTFLRGNLAILLILISIAAGVAALLITPREEEPQIVVPVADVIVAFPGGSAQEVEQLVASRLERLLYQIDGVEYVYSMSRPGMAVVTVRFTVGEDREDSLIKLYNKIQQNVDRVTPGIAGWVVKPIEIDDVPIVNVTLFSDAYDTHRLYRVAESVVGKLQHIDDSARITIHGGEKRVLHVRFDADRLAAYELSPLEIMGALQISNARLESGSFASADAQVRIEAGAFLRDARDVINLVVGIHQGRPVYLRDVAEVEDGPADLVGYTRIGFGPGEDTEGDARMAQASPGRDLPAVTIAVAKKKGSNAVWVARRVHAVLDELKGTIIPDEVSVRVTRDYGVTANEKVNDLVQNLMEAIITVIALIAFAMNWRVGVIVALAVPITYSLTLLVNMLAGYTINRVTLFALILALGLLVDDPIVAVENIYRHLALRRQPRMQAILTAMSEIMPPVILATLSVIVAFLPMFFITGMMGPYMRPMALNVPLAMISSLIVSFAITPWVASKMLKGGEAGGPAEPPDIRGSLAYRMYARVVGPFIRSRSRSIWMLVVTGGLFALSVVMALTVVPLKMLPFDNKNEFQLVVDMQEGTTLESTDAVVRDLEDYLRTVPEVTDFTSFVGLASPMDFNGMVRHYYMRQGPNLADVRVNLLHRTSREMDSHAIGLRIRDDIAAIAARHGGLISVVELPPGPPVLATVVAEVTGQPHHTYAALMAAASTVKDGLRGIKGVVDLDDTIQHEASELFFRVDREKAAQHAIAVEDVTRTLRIAMDGGSAGILHDQPDENEVAIVLRLPRPARSDPASLLTLPIKGRTGQLVQLGELGAFENRTLDQSIYHKNQSRVVYVTAEMAGRGPAYAVLDMGRHLKAHPLPPGIVVNWRGEGEWKITVDVFRDLGIAFAAALLGIYVLLVYETGSYALPGVIMMSIPLTMIGIMPGFWGLNLAVNHPVGGFENPVFFTATAMIGMIALAGIVVRNGIILIDFIRTSVARGVPLRDAILESGAVRFRPIFLTACTTMLGAWPITLDPIFSGLAWSIIFGLFVSTAFTLLVIPVSYWLIYGRKEAGLPPGAGSAGGAAVPESGGQS